MKRLVWLVLAVFATLLTRVEPADLPVTKQAACCCCGACDMPECPPPAPVHNPAPVLMLQTSAPTVATVARRIAAPRGQPEEYFVRFGSRRSDAPVSRVASASARPALVPLFAAHCSRLI